MTDLQLWFLCGMYNVAFVYWLLGQQRFKREPMDALLLFCAGVFGTVILLLVTAIGFVQHYLDE